MKKVLQWLLPGCDILNIKNIFTENNDQNLSNSSDTNLISLEFSDNMLPPRKDILTSNI